MGRKESNQSKQRDGQHQMQAIPMIGAQWLSGRVLDLRPRGPLLIICMHMCIKFGCYLLSVDFF